MLEMEYLLKTEWFYLNPKKAAKVKASLEERLQENQCSKGGRVLPVALMPLLIGDNERRLFQYTAEIMSRIIQKTVEASFTSARVRQYFAYEELPQEWLTSDPGYKAVTMLATFDVLFDGKNLHYIAFNTDNPPGLGWSDLVRAVMADHPFYKTLVMFPEAEARPYVLEEGFAATKTIYQEFRQGKTSSTRVVFIAYRGAENIGDTQLCVDFFNRRGVKATLVDPRDFQFKDGVAYVEEQRVDVVRRHINANEFLKYPKELQPFLKGYLSKAFCMVNPFRSVYGSEKAIFALITTPEFHHLYTEEEIKVIRRHIPWTRRMCDLETTAPDGGKIQLKQFVSQKREELVIKPSWGRGGENVTLGLMTTQEEWDKLVNTYQGNKDWVVQSYVPVPRIPQPVIKGKKVTVERKHFNLSLFVLNGKYVDTWGCVSGTPSTSLQKDGAILPVFRY